MKKVSYSINYRSKKYDFIYKRNYYGFRGEEIDPKDIKAVFMTVAQQMKDINLKIKQLQDT